MHDESVRLQLYLARCGIGSRRFCEELILARRVAVNGAVADKLGTKVSPNDEVRFDGTIVRLEKKLRYVLLNKPAGFVCSMSDEQGRKTASSLLQPYFSERLYNVERRRFCKTAFAPLVVYRKRIRRNNERPHSERTCTAF